MILDNVFIDTLGEMGEKFTNKYDLSYPPQSINDVHEFFKEISDLLEEKNNVASYFGLTFHQMVSSKEVRSRRTTATVFEDIIAKIFGGHVSDKSSSKKPEVSDSIKKMDQITEEYGWNISSDLSGNKLKKEDISFENSNLSLSLKTQKGKLYDIKNNNNGDNVLIQKDSSWNKELNAGSLSSRAVFVGLVENHSSLKDRKGGLGSQTQLISTYKKIEQNGNWDELINRFKSYLHYLYDDDSFMIVFKGGYKMTLHFLEGELLADILVDNIKGGPETAPEILHRWENNNIRLKLQPLFKEIENRGKSKKVTLDFTNIYNDKNAFLRYLKTLEKDIGEKIINVLE